MATTEWLNERRKGIGGSDAAAVCNLSKWNTPFDIWESKVKPLKWQPPSEPMEWGLRLESLIREHYVNVTGWKVSVPQQPVICQDHPFMRANLDGISHAPGGDRVLQVKTSSTDRDWGEEWTAQIPVAYKIQVQHEMICSGLAQADVPVLFSGSRFRIYTVPADPQVQRTLIGIEHKFWHEHVIPQKPPMLTEDEDLAKLFPTHEPDKWVTAMDGEHETVVELHRIHDQLDKLKHRKDELEQVLKHSLKDAEGLLDSEGRELCTWRGHTRRSVDTKAMSLEHAEIVEKYRTMTQVRRFMLKSLP